MRLGDARSRRNGDFGVCSAALAWSNMLGMVNDTSLFRTCPYARIESDPRTRSC